MLFFRFALYKIGDQELEIFDSLIIPQNLCIFIAKHFQAHIRNNLIRVQGPQSITCGVYCIFYLFHRYLNIDLLFEDFLDDFFEESFDKNEQIISKFKKHYIDNVPF